MNWENFSKWFKTQLIPNIEPGSIVILDNARYHNVFEDVLIPSKSSKKDQLRNWLTHNGYPWREDMLKSELFELCSRLAPAAEYKLDRLVAEHGISILRTPPYHPELQPIETCWAIVKNYMADNCDFSMAGLWKRLPEAFSKVTADTCKEIISKVFEQEYKYWAEDEALDEIYSKDSAEKRAGGHLYENQGEEFYLEAI